MNLKIISPKLHCILDYALSAVMVTVPKLLGLPKSVQKTGLAVGSSVLTLTSLTKSPVAAKSIIPFKTHYALDVPAVAGLALLTFNEDIRTNKKALIFHLSVVTIAALNVLLTDTGTSLTKKAARKTMHAVKDKSRKALLN
jgi:hypothetical protein